MPIYTDLRVMIRDIIGFMRSTGRNVLNADDPNRGTIGICTTDGPSVLWEICLSDVHRYGAGEYAQFFRSGGREALLTILREAARENLADQDRPERVMVERFRRFTEPFFTEAPVERNTAELSPPDTTESSVFDRLLQDDT